MPQSNMSAPSPPTIDPPLHPIQLVELWAHIAEEAGAAGAEGQAEVLTQCATALATWIRYEGVHAIMCMPQAYFRLIHAAMGYDPEDQDRIDDLQELIQAAVALKGSTQ